MIDLTPAAARTGAVVAAVPDDALDRPTPTGAPVAALLDHVGGLSLAFRAAARKQLGPLTSAAPAAEASRLAPDWRERIPLDLAALGEAWRDPAAWEGMSQAGGVDLPGEMAGLVAIDEVVVHGWDIAVATGQRYEPSTEDVEAALAFVSSFEAPRDGSLFGPVVAVPDDSTAFHRLLGLTGRDPGWRPPR